LAPEAVVDPTRSPERPDDLLIECPFLVARHRPHGDGVVDYPVLAHECGMPGADIDFPIVAGRIEPPGCHDVNERRGSIDGGPQFTLQLANSQSPEPLATGQSAGERLPPRPIVGSE
jgi:hypothetical protein